MIGDLIDFSLNSMYLLHFVTHFLRNKSNLRFKKKKFGGKKKKKKKKKKS